MLTTVASIRAYVTGETVTFHCSGGHVFTIPYEDLYGEWCPECGESAHSYEQKDCHFCRPVWVDASHCFG